MGSERNNGNQRNENLKEPGNYFLHLMVEGLVMDSAI
jgi:hypothetical protein